MSSRGGLPMFEYLNKDAFVIFTSVFSAVTILANLFLMIIILASPKLRTSSKHILIFVFCLTDLYSGVFEFPLLAQFYSLEEWIHHGEVLRGLDVSTYFVMISLRITLIIAICADSILSMLTRNQRVRILLSVSMIIASLGYSLILAFPVSESPGPNPSDNCYWSVQETKSTFISVAAFFPQALVMVVLVVDLTIMSCCFSRTFSESGEEGRKPFPIDVVLACVLMLVYVVPFRIVHGYFSSCSGACQRMHLLRGITGRWESVRPCVMPFVWLLCRETRNAIKQVCCCTKTEPSSNLSGNTQNIKNCEMLNQKESYFTKL